jgi:hypothetical protein
MVANLGVTPPRFPAQTSQRLTRQDGGRTSRPSRDRGGNWSRRVAPSGPDRRRLSREACYEAPEGWKECYVLMTGQRRSWELQDPGSAIGDGE